MYDTTPYDGKQLGGRVRSSMSDIVAELSDLTDALAEQRFQRGFLEIVTLNDCIRYYREEIGKLQGVSVAGFVLSVQKNLDPRNENDNYIVVQGLVSAKDKPITVNGESVSRIMHTRTIDDALINALNGKDSIIFRV
ncbi:MAG: hypothetical protein LUD07_12445 [Clostridiales bacterium]|nr:hypothetical protein [Clostridiales bacterium]